MRTEVTSQESEVENMSLEEIVEMKLEQAESFPTEKWEFGDAGGVNSGKSVRWYLATPSGLEPDDTDVSFCIEQNVLSGKIEKISLYGIDGIKLEVPDGLAPAVEATVEKIRKEILALGESSDESFSRLRAPKNNL